MIEAPLGLAFAAGLVATVNPCGFAMLPAYLSYFMGLEGADDDAADDVTLGRALVVGGIVSAGFLVVFGVTGLLINAGVRSIIDVIPWVALLVGLAMVGLGVAMLRGYELSIGFLKVQGGTGSREKKSVFSFGVSYAVASLSCTLPVFLSVVVGSITSTNFVSGLLTYVAYGLGMSLVLMTLTIGLAFAKQGLVRRLRSALRYVHTVSAGFLIVAGAYITWFWVDDLTSDPGEQGAAARIVEGWSARLTDFVDGHSGVIGLLFGGLLAIAVLSSVLKRFAPAAPADPPALVTAEGAKSRPQQS